MTSPIPISTGLHPRLVRLSWGAVSVLTVASIAGSALAPLLLVKSPLLLTVLAPDARHLALVAGRIDPTLLVAVTVARRALYSVAVYGLGLAYGSFAVNWIEARAKRLGGALRALERLFARVGAVLLVALPFLSLCVLAGAARTRLTVFLPTLLLGHCLWVGVTVWLGKRFAETSQRISDFFSERLLESTLVCVAVMVIYQLVSQRKSRPT